MRLGFTERSVRIDAARIGAHADPRLLHGVAQVVFVHGEVNGANVVATGGNEVEDDVEGVLLFFGGNLGDGVAFVFLQRRVEHRGDQNALGAPRGVELVLGTVAAAGDGLADRLTLSGVF